MAGGTISKLRSFGISGNLLGIIKSYIHGRSLSVVGNGHSSIDRPIWASVPPTKHSRISTFGSSLISFNVRAGHADGCTMPITRKRDDHKRAMPRIILKLQIIVARSRRCRDIKINGAEFICGLTYIRHIQQVEDWLHSVHQPSI